MDFVNWLADIFTNHWCGVVTALVTAAVGFAITKAMAAAAIASGGTGAVPAVALGVTFTIALTGYVADNNAC